MTCYLSHDYARSYRIGEVAELIGEPVSVLRYWEQEFNIRVERSKSGQRVYRQAHVQRLEVIRELLRGQRFTIEGAKKQLSKAPLLEQTG